MAAIARSLDARFAVRSSLAASVSKTPGRWDGRCALIGHVCRGPTPPNLWAKFLLKVNHHICGLAHAASKVVVSESNRALFWTDHWIEGQSIKELAPMVLAVVGTCVVKGEGYVQFALGSAEWQTSQGRSTCKEFLNSSTWLRSSTPWLCPPQNTSSSGASRHLGSNDEVRTRRVVRRFGRITSLAFNLVKLGT